jgi:hypothetical protein
MKTDRKGSFVDPDQIRPGRREAAPRPARLTILFVFDRARDTFFTEWSCGKIEIAQLSVASG